MYFCTYSNKCQTHLGIARDASRQHITDLSSAWPGKPAPRDIAELVALGEKGLEESR